MGGGYKDQSGYRGVRCIHIAWSSRRASYWGANAALVRIPRTDRVRGMKGDAVELCNLEVAVEVGPAHRGLIVQPPDAAVVAIQQPAQSIKADSVVIGVWPTPVRSDADVRPGSPAVQATNDTYS